MVRLLVVILLGAVAAVGSSTAVYSAVSASPGNALATGAGTWFVGNATGTAVCAGTNAALACPFGLLTGVGRVTATIALQNKGVATSYTLTISDGTGPAPISTIVTATFVSNAGRTVGLGAGAADTAEVVARIKGNTPVGSYSGALVIADTTTGASVRIPLSLAR